MESMRQMMTVLQRAIPDAGVASRNKIRDLGRRSIGAKHHVDEHRNRIGKLAYP